MEAFSVFVFYGEQILPQLDRSSWKSQTSIRRCTLLYDLVLPRSCFYHLTLGALVIQSLFEFSFFCGLFVFIGYIGQAIGLAEGSTPEKSAFIASLCVVWVPLLQSILSINDWTKQKWGSTFRNHRYCIFGVGRHISSQRR